MFIRNLQKLSLYIAIFITLLVIFFVINALINHNPKTTENINYKLVNENGISSMYMRTNQSEQTFYLKITPKIKKPYPAIFTIFMNGKQIECFWDENLTTLYYTTIYPNKDKLIKIRLNEIPEGLNTLLFGVVYFPSKIDFKEEELYKYTLGLTPFTIVRGNNIIWSEGSLFKNYMQPNFINKKMPVGMSGILSISKDDLVPDLISRVDEHKILYYLWQNTDDKIRKVRFSLIKDWKQIPWPSGNLFIDVTISPGDIFYKEILISEIAKNEIIQ